MATAAPPPAARPRDAGRLLPRLPPLGRLAAPRPPPGRLRDLLAPLALTPRAARKDGWVGWSGMELQAQLAQLSQQTMDCVCNANIKPARQRPELPHSTGPLSSTAAPTFSQLAAQPGVVEALYKGSRQQLAWGAQRHTQMPCECMASPGTQHRLGNRGGHTRHRLSIQGGNRHPTTHQKRKLEVRPALMHQTKDGMASQVRTCVAAPYTCWKASLSSRCPMVLRQGGSSSARMRHTQR